LGTTIHHTHLHNSTTCCPVLGVHGCCPRFLRSIQSPQDHPAGLDARRGQIQARAESHPAQAVREYLRRFSHLSRSAAARTARIDHEPASPDLFVAGFRRLFEKPDPRSGARRREHQLESSFNNLEVRCLLTCAGRKKESSRHLRDFKWRSCLSDEPDRSWCRRIILAQLDNLGFWAQLEICWRNWKERAQNSGKWIIIL
jgi:hypothetical protein